MKRSYLVILLALLAVTPAYAALSDDLVGYWGFDTNLTHDETGNNPLGIYGSTYANDGGLVGNAFFANNSAILESTGENNFFAIGSNDRSVSFWVKPNTVTTSQQFVVLGTWATPNDRGWQLAGFVSPTNIELKIDEFGSWIDTSTELALNDWTHVVAVFDSAANKYIVYFNGTNTFNGSDGDANNYQAGNITIGGVKGVPVNQGLRGAIDEVGAWNRTLTPDEVSDLYNSGAGLSYSDITGGGGGGVPYASVNVKDLYDNTTLEGLTVWIGTDSNLTNGAGTATVYNYTGLNYTIDGGTLYFNDSGTATENTTVTDYLYGAFVRINASNILDEALSNFTTTPDNTSWTNSTTEGFTFLYLKPNATNNVTIRAYDGNYTYNSTSQTYLNFTLDVNTSGRDTGNYTLEGLYQAFLTVNASKGTTTSYIENVTVNVTGIEHSLDYSENTTTFNTTFQLMFGNYTIVGDPQDYSLTTPTNYSIAPYNYTPSISLPAYALNSFYFDILDEITSAAISENMTIELISDLDANTYTTTNGSLALELLTPTNYSIRYRSTLASNYTERDYYQTLVNNNYYDLSLYSLANDEATDMIVTVKDTAGDPIEDATVKLLRYYTTCNCYNTVEMSKTSVAGEAYFIADAYDGHYKFAVEYLGETQFLSTSPENFIPTSGLITRTITINLGAAYFESFRELTDIARTITYNNETKGLSFTWNDPSGIVTRGCLYAEYLNGVHYTSVTPNCQNASVGSVVLQLNNSVASYKYYAELETSTTYSDYVVFSGVIDKIRTTLLAGDVQLGAFFGAAIVIVLGLMFSFSAIAVVIVTAVGVIGMWAIGMFTVATVFVTGLATLILGIAAYLMRS